MPIVRLSIKAEDDLTRIVWFTLRKWGSDQAIRYRQGLESFLDLVALNPGMGRLKDEFGFGVRRVEWGRHVVFYETDTSGIFVLRLLHDRMMPSRQDIEEN